MEQAIRRILGIDLKMKQYEQGSHFVKTVVEEAGMETFNKVWTSPDTVPTRRMSCRARVPGWSVSAAARQRAPRTEPTVGGPHPAVAEIRHAVRQALASLEPGDLVLAGCSGGADSLALAAALAFEAPKAGLRGGAITVDHCLQPGSGDVAAQVAAKLAGLGSTRC